MTGADPRDWAEVIASRLLALAMGKGAEAQALGAVVVGVMNLHTAKGEGRLLVCEGCDFDGYDAERPPWPCTTVMTIADDLGIPVNATCGHCAQNMDLHPDGTVRKHFWATRQQPGRRTEYVDCPGSEQPHSDDRPGADQQESTHT